MKKTTHLNSSLDLAARVTHSEKRSRLTVASSLLFALLSAVAIGCSDGGGDSVGGLSDGESDIEVKKLALHPRVKIVPSDGSVVATLIGEQGVQFTGLSLSNVVDGDYLIAVTPITDAAREVVNHKGGYFKLAKGFHLIPREQMDESFITPGNEGYSHFLVHTARVIQRLVEPGPLAHQGAVAFASKASANSDIQVRGFISSVGSFFTNAANSVASAAKSVANVVTNAVSSPAAQVVAATVAAVYTAAGTAATSAVSSAFSNANVNASLVASAAAGAASLTTGTIKAALPESITTFETAGADLTEMVEALEVEIDSVSIHPKMIALDVPNFAEEVKGGTLHATVESDGTLDITLTNYRVESDDRTQGATLNGKIRVFADEYGVVEIKQFNPEDVEMDFAVNAEVSVELTNVHGTGILPVRAIQFTPEVVDSMVPVIIGREIELGLLLNGSADRVTIQAKGQSVAKLEKRDTTPVEASGYVNFTGSGSIDGSASSTTLRILPHVSLFDAAGPFLQLDLTSTRDGSSDLKATVSVGTDFAQAGYSGWNVDGTVASVGVTQ